MKLNDAFEEQINVKNEIILMITLMNILNQKNKNKKEVKILTHGKKIGFLKKGMKRFCQKRQR